MPPSICHIVVFRFDYLSRVNAGIPIEVNELVPFPHAGESDLRHSLIGSVSDKLLFRR